MEVRQIDWSTVPLDDYYATLSSVAIGEYVATMPANMEHMTRIVFHPIPPGPSRIKFRRALAVIDGQRRRIWERVE